MAVCLAILVACAVGPEPPARFSRLKPFAPTDHDAVSAVLRTGFSEISEKAVIEPRLDELFLAGYRDFWHFDPALGFGADDSRLTLVGADGKIIANLDRPDQQNLKGWIDVTIQLFESARWSSPVARYADAESLYSVMFDAALARVDKYSRYAGRSSARGNRESRNGFVGLGFTFDIGSDGIIVRSLTDSGPMANAGVQVGDTILAVDGQATAGLTRNAVQKLMSGPPQTSVRLSLRRAGESEVASADARRGLIIPKTVKAELSNGVGRIEITGFNLRTASDVGNAVIELKKEGARGFILDVRGDPGGLLDQCVEIADMFLDSGTIATLSGRHPGAKQFYEAKRGDIAEGLPIIVLIDGKSASAAEIVAAALTDHGRAVAVGTNTLGKGSVQTLIRLPNDGELALTWSQTWAPDGYRIHELGLLPSLCTSGVDDPMDDVIASSLKDRTMAVSSRDAWRRSPMSAAERAELRALCPAEARPDRKVDFAIAERLLSDLTFYASAVATSQAAAR